MNNLLKIRYIYLFLCKPKIIPKQFTTIKQINQFLYKKIEIPNFIQQKV